MVMQPYNPKTPEILERLGFNAKKAKAAIRGGKVELSDDEKKRAAEIQTDSVREIVDVCRINGIKIITLDDRDYPLLLKNIENPPIVLFCAGNLNGTDKAITVSVVGTRKPSEYSVSVTGQIISQLCEVGAVITSGLAMGIDREVHKACINSGGRTIGVLGCGIMVNYPAKNAKLKRDIIANGGAVISELLPYSKPSGDYFQHRNRIISGLSKGTLIIEADENSGALLTATHACDQGRDVFYIPPHDILSESFMGAALLARDGAVPVFGHIDILGYLLGREELKKLAGKS